MSDHVWQWARALGLFLMVHVEAESNRFMAKKGSLTRFDNIAPGQILPPCHASGRGLPDRERGCRRQRHHPSGALSAMFVLEMFCSFSL